MICIEFINKPDIIEYLKNKWNVKSPILLHWKKESLIDKIKGIFK